MDVIVDQAYIVAQGLYAFSLAFQEYSAQKFPYAPVIVLIAHCINGSMAVHSANKDKPTLYWLHSLVTTVLAGFGGGIITPVILGARPSIIFANDLVIPVSCTIWYLTNYCGFDKVFSFKPVKLLWNVVVTLWRTNACINAVNLACDKITPGPYYPAPVMGSIIGGTLINSLGAFVPFDKGLSPIQKGTAFPIQSAFLTACLYFFILKDRNGFIGIALRSIVGDLSQRVVVGIMTGFQVLTLASQVIFDDPNANFLTPVFQVLYYVSRVQGPLVTPPAVVAPVVPAKVIDSDNTNTDSTTKNTAVTTKVSPVPAKKGFTFAQFTWLVRGTIVFFALSYYVSLHLPATSIPAVKASVYSVNDVPYVTLNTLQMSRLSGSSPIGINQWLQFVPFSVPANTAYVLRLEQHSVCTTPSKSAEDNTVFCEVPPECTHYNTVSTCERSLGALSGLQDRKTTSTGYRLAVHTGAGRHLTLPTHVFTADTNSLVTTPTHTTWTAVLPLSFTSAGALVEIDSRFSFDQVELYLTTSSEVFLVYKPQFAGNIFNVYKLSARVLWSGIPEVTCANKNNSTSSGSVEAVSLYLDPVHGTPRILCSDGDSIAFNIGTVMKSAEYNDTAIMVPPVEVVDEVESERSAVDTVTTKSEL